MQNYTISLLLLQQSSNLSTLCGITLLHTIYYNNIALLQYLRLLHKIHCDKIALTLATKTCWLVWPVDPSPTHSLALFWHKRREPYHTVTLLHSLHYNTVALLQKCIHCTLTGLHNLTATILHCCTIWLLPYCTVTQFGCYHSALLHNLIVTILHCCTCSKDQLTSPPTLWHWGHRFSPGQSGAAFLGAKDLDPASSRLHHTTFDSWPPLWIF